MYIGTGFSSIANRYIMFELEYLAVYGRASMGVPAGELQSTMAPTKNTYLLITWVSNSPIP